MTCGMTSLLARRRGVAWTYRCYSTLILGVTGCHGHPEMETLREAMRGVG